MHAFIQKVCNMECDSSDRMYCLQSDREEMVTAKTFEENNRQVHQLLIAYDLFIPEACNIECQQGI